MKPKNNHSKPVCPKCGYKAVWLHPKGCPMCKICVHCKKRVRDCECREGE